MSRLISWVRPPIRPFTDSRSEGVLVAAGSMAYSAVTQPSPEPFRQRGTPPDAEAAHTTRVRGAQHPGPPELHQHRARRVVEPVPGDLDRAELVVGPSICTRHGAKP